MASMHFSSWSTCRIMRDTFCFGFSPSRFERCILVSSPVYTTSPMIQSVLRSMVSRISSALPSTVLSRVSLADVADRKPRKESNDLLGCS